MITYANETMNLGEATHSTIRKYNYNKPEYRQTDLYKALTDDNLTFKYHSLETRGSDHVGFVKAKSKRLELIKQTSIPWTAKENTEKQTIDFDFVDYCINNKNINVYMTHRENIVDQFISTINARYRTEIAKSGTFIYTNQQTQRPYETMEVKFSWLYLYLNVFIDQLLMWRFLYDKYKPHIKLVSYEKEIKPMKFENIGISSSIVDKYKKETQYLVPTPYNTSKVIVTDDHPKPIVGAWEQSLYYVEKFKHLVEI
jgi:hypothetical protein